jgi:hypothetical protein
MLDVLGTLIAVKREKEGCVGFGRAVRGERQRWKVQWWWLRRRKRWESLLGAAACAGC